MTNYSWKFSCVALFSILATSLVPLLLGPSPAQGASYYVATNGSDSNPGTLNQPFKSFKKGVSLLQPGDTLYIRGGTYTEQMDFQGPNISGTSTGWIRIAGYPGEIVISQYASGKTGGYGPIKARGNRGYFIFENLILDGVNGADATGWALRDGNHHFILRNLEIKNFKTTGLFIIGNDIQVLNCKIHDSVVDPPPRSSRRYGIYFSMGDNVVIDGIEIYNQPGGGITVFPGPVHKAIIRNNVIHHNNIMENSSVPGIQIFADIDYTIHGPGVIDDVQIYNNVVHSNCVNKPGGGTCGGIQVSNGATGTRVWNNTVYGNKGYGILVNAGDNGPAIDTVVQNNIVFANTSQQIIDTGIDSIISHNLTTDPKFIKADAFDFRLQTHSLAIDAGIDIDTIRVDIKNVPRPGGRSFDIGAYEGGVSDSNPLNAPKNLSIK
ncbi:MAG: right-handed parallel beta-helix repeat-containing protein [Nitrospira sp.]|nr:right-handed parallel beta-helix repeat-containing protein [Nitrospira sp.]MDH4244009.1 right-handed parallel beta-helix repeat-containing protein [Nitrospira sp.]MDH4355881.1 right-handed parallel beta-helix repeat-containing protein [Nitrospira sp.]MDH5317904.1 right-handed parallel beta-helix repeat-containing protein [Nitrospira sp.]